jgi:hypothetical protein
MEVFIERVHQLGLDYAVEDRVTLFPDLSSPFIEIDGHDESLSCGSGMRACIRAPGAHSIASVEVLGAR